MSFYNDKKIFTKTVTIVVDIVTIMVNCAFVECVIIKCRILDMELVEIFTMQFRILGRKIAYYRVLKGLSQIQFAQKIGISASYLSKIERANLESISLSTLMAIACGLDIPVYMLLKFDKTDILSDGSTTHKS